MSADQRQTPRNQLNQYLRVLDADTRSPLGRLVDISQKGMMLIGSTPLALQEEYRMAIALPSGDELRLTATCIWTRSGITHAGHIGNGFRFVAIPGEQLALFNELIELSKVP